MIKRIFGIATVAILMVSCNEDKTAYVDTKVLIQDYKEMKDLEAEYQLKSDSAKQQVDSVAKIFQQEVEAYQSQAASMSADARQQKEQELMQMNQLIQRQQQMISQQLRQESGVAMDSLIERVKDYVADYGKEHGYTYIFGSNENANIMYAKEGLDITQEILKELNDNYGGDSSSVEASEEIEEEKAEKVEDSLN